MADAIVEAKGGLLSVAHNIEEGEDITMADVIVNVEEKIAENDRRRRQRNEERRAAQANRRPYNRDNRNGNGPRSGKPFVKKETVKPAATTEAAPAPAAE